MVLHWLHMVRHPRYRYMLSFVLSISSIFTSHCFAPRQLFKRTNSSGVSIPTFLWRCRHSFGDSAFSVEQTPRSCTKAAVGPSRRLSFGPAGFFCAVLAFWHCLHTFLRPFHAFLRHFLAFLRPFHGLSTLCPRSSWCSESLRWAKCRAALC